MTTREYVIKWHRGDKRTGVGEAVERWARVLSLVLIPVVLAVGGHVVSQRLAKQQLDLEYVKTALSVLQSKQADERLRDWAVQVLNRFSDIRLDTVPELQSALETGSIVIPTLGTLTDTVQRETWRFCVNARVKYVSDSTTWSEFLSAPITLLSFYGPGTPPEVSKTEIETFAARLDTWLAALGFFPKEGARAAVRAVVGNNSSTITDLLDVVAKNYAG